MFSILPDLLRSVLFHDRFKHIRPRLQIKSKLKKTLGNNKIQQITFHTYQFLLYLLVNERETLHMSMTIRKKK